MKSHNYLLEIKKEVKVLLLPILATGGDANKIIQLFRDFGWDMDAALGVNIGSLSDLVSEIITDVNSFNSKKIDLDSLENVLDLVTDVAELITLLNSIKDFPNTTINSQLALDIAKDFVNKLFVLYLNKRYPLLYHVFHVFDIITYEDEVPRIANDVQVNLDSSIPRLKLSNFSKFIKNPLEQFKEIYYPEGIEDYEEAALVMSNIYFRISPILEYFGIESAINDGEESILPASLDDNLKSMVSLRFPIKLNSTNVTSELLFSLGIIPESDGGPGVFVVPLTVVDFVKVIGSWLLHIKFEKALGGFIISNSGVDFLDTAIKNSRIKISATKEETSAIQLLSTNGPRIEIGSFSLNCDITILEDSFDFDISSNVLVRFIINSEKQDGFISKVFKKININAESELTLGFSNKKGFYINQNSSLEAKLKIHSNEKSIIKIDDIIIGIKPADGNIKLGAKTNLTLQIGVLTININNIGLSSVLDFNAPSPNLGLFDLQTKISPPTGLGMAIKSSTVNGGGFIKFEPDDHRYIGALELKIKKISLGVIGILKTKLPGGKDGYSLLLIVTVEGFKPIALGFGFSLSGVGGLLGLNRTADIAKLRDGLRTGANQSILFPKDIIKNIDKIVSDLETCFPDKEGRFLVGPMVKIIWGTPKPLITIDLGLIIEIPEPVKIIILGVVVAALPDDKKPKLIIKINFMGTIEFDKKLIAFDATIYESKILTFDISGDMAFRLKWGDQSNFLLSVGGFHPAYTPPPLDLPPLRRLALSLVNKEHLKVGLETYFAITSNTVQVGAKILAYAEHGKYNAIGVLWLDVLFQFSPFMFIADMGAMVAIRKGSDEILSASLKATLQGPTPWSVRGTAEFKILKIGFKIDFNETFGDKAEEKLEDKELWPDLLAAINHKDSWTTLLPERNQLFVNVKNDTTNPNALFVHPLGRLALNQNFTPMNFSLQKFGPVRPKDYKKFRIESVTNNNNAALTYNAIKDKFAPSQFIPMSDEQKISRPSFEDFESGISIGLDNLVSSYKVNKELTYQAPKVFDRRMKYTLTGIFKENTDFCNAVIANSSVSKAFANPRKTFVAYDAPTQTTLKTKQYAVANKTNMGAYDTQRFTSMADAQAYVTQILKNSPAQKNKLIVTDALELA